MQPVGSVTHPTETQKQPGLSRNRVYEFYTEIYRVGARLGGVIKFAGTAILSVTPFVAKIQSLAYSAMKLIGLNKTHGGSVTGSILKTRLFQAIWAPSAFICIAKAVNQYSKNTIKTPEFIGKMASNIGYLAEISVKVLVSCVELGYGSIKQRSEMMAAVPPLFGVAIIATAIEMAVNVRAIFAVNKKLEGLNILDDRSEVNVSSGYDQRALLSDHKCVDWSKHKVKVLDLKKRWRDIRRVKITNVMANMISIVGVAILIASMTSPVNIAIMGLGIAILGVSSVIKCVSLVKDRVSELQFIEDVTGEKMKKSRKNFMFWTALITTVCFGAIILGPVPQWN